MGNSSKSPMSLTPVPTVDLEAISRNVLKASTALVRLESKVDSIKDDLLPPVAKDAKEARDSVIQLNGRVNALEEAPLPSHMCVEKDRQTAQDSYIAETRVKVANTSRLVWWILGVAVLVGGAAIGFALTSSTQSGANSTRLDSHAGDISRNERDINVLEKARQEDRDLFIQEVRGLPSRVKTASQSSPLSLDDLEEVSDDLPLTDYEKIALRRLLKRARSRQVRTAQ